MRRLCCECGVKQIHEDNEMCKDCEVTEPIIRNPMTLNDDALGESCEPASQTDGDPLPLNEDKMGNNYYLPPQQG